LKKGLKGSDGGGKGLGEVGEGTKTLHANMKHTLEERGRRK